MARAQSEAAITPQDACYLRVCLKLKAYDALAASDGILAAPAMDVAPALDATDFLLRCYYGGRALLALRRYRRSRAVVSKRAERARDGAQRHRGGGV